MSTIFAVTDHDKNNAKAEFLDPYQALERERGVEVPLYLSYHNFMQML